MGVEGKEGNEFSNKSIPVKRDITLIKTTKMEEQRKQIFSLTNI